MAAPASNRSVQLDFLRGVAILLVVAGHWVDPPQAAGSLHWIATPLKRFGWTGVDLFFVLSGFLIGGLLFAEIRDRGRLDVRRFLVRRAWKILPPYFALLAFAFAKVCWKGEGWVAARPMLPNLLHLQNYLGTSLRHTWSLAVEEHFYLALPLFLLLLGSTRVGLRALPWLVAAASVGCLVTRVATLRPPWDQFTHLSPTHLRIDSLSFGVLLAYLAVLRPEGFDAVASRRRTLLVAGLVLVAPMFVYEAVEPFAYWYGYTMLYLGYGCILTALVRTPLDAGPAGAGAGAGITGRVLSSRPARAVAWVGFYSYSIFLWHIALVLSPIQRVRPWISGWPGWARWAGMLSLYVAASCAAGVLMAWLIERPAIVLRDRLWPARARTDAALPPEALRGGFTVRSLTVAPAPR